MEIIIVPIVALCASALTLFSGFGLGTLLLPAFALFFPIEIAIAMTALVHFTNNIFKFALVFRNINLKVALQFALPGIIASLLGASLLNQLSTANDLFQYSMWGHVFHIKLMKIIVAMIMLAFALLEIKSSFEERFKFEAKYIYLGGFLSGFFGGISGHQGGLRSAFLIRLNLAKEQFIATGVAIAIVVDIARLGVYSNHIQKIDLSNINLIIISCLAAFLGAWFGNKLVKKTKIEIIQKIVAYFLIVISLLIAAGII